MIFESYSAEDTKNIAFSISKNAKTGQVFCLCGDLGTGKTVFAKGFAEGLSIFEHITSPTFTIVNEYEGSVPFYHFDVYRIGDTSEMDEIGIDEYLYNEGICLIEWAELIADVIPKEATWIFISKDLAKGDDFRQIKVEVSQ